LTSNTKLTAMNFTPMDFINREIANVEMAPMKEFMMRYHECFESDLDLDFMDYFLELSKRENRNQFVVHHEKLFEYGITIDKESRRVKERIDSLGLGNDIDYRLTKVREPVAQGGYSTKNVYHFTPRAFKKILLSARPHARHEINVDRYREYYLFLEEVIGYYSEYQIMYKDHRNAMLSTENKSLTTENKTLSEQIVEQANIQRKELAERDALHQKQLAETLRVMQESADRQRAEILGETKHARNEAKLAKEEVVKAREDISDLHETIIDHHEIAMKTAQHTSVDVKPAQRQYFAMTAYSRVGDNTGKLFFKNWRRQAVSMASVLVNALSESSTDKDGNQYTAHSLIIPPIYFAGAVNLGNAGKYNLDKFVKSKISELNRSRERGDKLTMTEFKNTIGLSTSSIHPTWAPNDHMSHCKFVDCFLDVIKNTKVIKLSVAEPKLQAQIDTKQRECFQALINLTGKAREDIDGMIAKVRDEMSTPPPSDDDECTTDTE
jgi:hypothetical protein